MRAAVHHLEVRVTYNAPMGEDGTVLPLRYVVEYYGESHMPKATVEVRMEGQIGSPILVQREVLPPGDNLERWALGWVKEARARKAAGRATTVSTN